ASPEDAQAWQQLLQKLSQWKGTRPTGEEAWLAWLAETCEVHTAAEADKLLARIPAEPARLEAASEPCRLAVLYRQLQLKKLNKESAEALMPIISQLVFRLLQSTTLAPGSEELLALFDGWIKDVQLLSKQSNLSSEMIQQLAGLYSGRARLIVENQYAPWLPREERLKTALEDLTTALQVTARQNTAERAGLEVWAAYVRKQLQRNDRRALWKNGQPSNRPAHAVPLLYYLKGEASLEDARAARDRETRLQLVEQSAGHYQKALQETEAAPKQNYWRNLSRLGASQAALEHANYLEVEESNRQLCRQLLEKSLQWAREVASDSAATMLHADAELAQGNACEDFGLLLDEPRHEEAISHFSRAVQLLQGNKLQAKAYVNRARAMLRSEQAKYNEEIDKDLQQAVALNPVGDTASELHLWRAHRQHMAHQLKEAKDTLQLAIKEAVTRYFKDHAYCKLLELVIITPMSPADYGAESKLKDRIQEITELIQQMNAVDPQIQREAEFQTVNALNEINDLLFLLMKLDPDKKDADKKAYEDLFWKYLTQLRASESPVARWHTARHEGKWNIMKGKLPEAWKALDMDGKFVQELSDFEKRSPKDKLRIKYHFLHLATTRFELLVSSPQTLSMHNRKNLQVMERVRQLYTREDPFAAQLTSMAGLLCRNVLKIDDKEKPLTQLEKTRLTKDALSNLREAVAMAPNSPSKWKWLFFITELPEDPAEKNKYKQMTVQAINQLSESQMSAKDKSQYISVVESFVSK
ncbi:MAG TPA: hypothetical protein PKD72_03035, partial [Gemmatales bacterium]|nr:hypothetical protein [Gemmatales bacterium]